MGENAVLTIAQDLAYGEEGSQPTIQPNAKLQFDVELLSVQDCQRRTIAFYSDVVCT